MADQQKPVHEVRLGRIKATIWANEVKDGIRHNVQIRRIYKDGDDWKSTDGFDRDNLLLVAKVCDMAHTWIYEKGLDNA